MFFLLLLIPLFVILYIWIQRQRRRAAAGYGNLGLMQNEVGRKPGMRRHIPPLIFLISLAVLIVALARPQAVVNQPRIEGTVMLVFDVSGSMGADDMKPTRLEAAKTAAQDFVMRQPSTVQIGVAKHLNAGQLSSILNMWRFRRSWYNPALRNNPNAGGGSNQIGKSSGQSNTVAVPPADGRQQHIDYTAPPDLTTNTAGAVGGVLNHDPKIITQTLAATTPTPITGVTADDVKTMQPRECLLCDSDGKQFYAIVHMTGGYTKP